MTYLFDWIVTSKEFEAELEAALEDYKGQEADSRAEADRLASELGDKTRALSKKEDDIASLERDLFKL